MRSEMHRLTAHSKLLGMLMGAGSLLGTCAYAADVRTRPMHFDHVTLQDGLTQSSVMSILQDSHGFIWLATENGLNRYDGYSVRGYTRDRRNPSALRNDFIWAIDEDADGNLWLATQGGGVARWHRKTDSFESFLHDPEDSNTLASDIIRTLVIGPKGGIWVGTRESGLDLLDPVSGQVIHFRHDSDDNRSLSSDSVYALLVDRWGQLWIGTDAGLNRFDPASGEFTRYQHDPRDAHSLSDDSIISIFEDHDGVLWVGTFMGGLNRLDQQSGRFTHYRHDADDPSSLSHDHVRVIFEEDDGRLWVGTQDGLNLMDRESGQFIRHRHEPANPRSLGDSYIMALHEDRSGTLWVGTRAAGASKWNPRSWSLGHYRDEWLYDTDVTSFADDGAGSVWVGTFGAGLARLDADLDRVDHYGRDAAGGETGLSDDNVMSLLLDREGMLWIGTMMGGVNRLDPRTGGVVTFRHDPADPASLGADGIMSLFEDRAGDIWLGTFGGGVSQFERRSGVFQRYPHDPDDPESLGSPRATAIAQDAGGAIWVGTDGGGLNLLDRDSGTFRRFGDDSNDPTSLSSDTVYALHVDASGTLWVGTGGGGLDRVVGSAGNPDDIRFENVSMLDGLPSNVIYGVQSDRQGNLWLSTNNGLTRFDPATGHVKTLHRSHGLQGEEFNFGAHHRGVGGRLYFGGANGFNAYYPMELDEADHAPAVVLTSVETLNQPAETAAPYELLESLELGHRDDVVTFEFAALDFIAPGENRYAYRLDGFDRDWIDIGNRRRVTYTNLDAGDYVFRVKAANSDGVWNETGLIIPVHVAPAPWETRWAYAGYYGSGLIALLVLWRHQRRKLLREAAYSRELEREVRQRTDELEHRNTELQDANRAKSDFLARMSHEIRTPMNGVLGMTELLLGTGLDDKQQRFASTIHRSAGSLLEIINDILDFSKIEAGKLELETVEFDLIDLVEDAVELLAGPASEKGLEFICATPPDHVPRVLGDPLRLRQVLINLVGNAVKFTDQGEVIVRFNLVAESLDNVEIRFEVEDSGVGISRENQALIFDCFTQEDGSTTRRYGGTGLGLAISKQLVELMGGELGVDSVPGEGSMFWFTVTMKKAKSLAAVRWTAQSFENLRVLVADSNATHRNILQRQLAAWRVRTKCARSGVEALEYLKGAATAGAPYDLAILDMSLRDMDGEKLVRAIRDDKNLSSTRLLLMSSMATTMASEAQDKLGVDRYLTKPVRQSYLYDTLIGLTSRAGALSVNTAAEDDPVAGTSFSSRVLLVEDNPVNQAVAVGMLSHLGCDVDVVDHGEAAVERLAAHHDYDLVFMDCQMPVMDGFKATTVIRQREGERRRTPIVALTASALDGDRERCLAAGMDDYLSKPFTLQSLSSVLRRWLKPGDAPSVDARSDHAVGAEDVVLDQTALDCIRSLEGSDNPDMLGQVIVLYLSNSEGLMRKIAQSFDHNDAAGVYQAAHTLKSSSANLGAIAFADVCRELERKARNACLHEAEGLYHRLINLYPRVVSALQLELRKKSA